MYRVSALGETYLLNSRHLADEVYKNIFILKKCNASSSLLLRVILRKSIPPKTMLSFLRKTQFDQEFYFIWCNQILTEKHVMQVKINWKLCIFRPLGFC